MVAMLPYKVFFDRNVLLLPMESWKRRNLDEPILPCLFSIVIIFREWFTKLVLGVVVSALATVVLLKHVGSLELLLELGGSFTIR